MKDFINDQVFGPKKCDFCEEGLESIGWEYGFKWYGNLYKGRDEGLVICDDCCDQLK